MCEIFFLSSIKARALSKKRRSPTRLFVSPKSSFGRTRANLQRETRERAISRVDRLPIGTEDAARGAIEVGRAGGCALPLVETRGIEAGGGVKGRRRRCPRIHQPVEDGE